MNTNDMRLSMTCLSASIAILGQLAGQTQTFRDSLMVEARAWYRDSARNIRYADWKAYPSHTIDMISGYRPGKADMTCPYGGDASRKRRATGFFRTEKTDGRWTVVDPDGHPFVVAAVNSFRQGKSPDNQAAFARAFGTVENWASGSIRTFRDLGFNTAGSWSETDAIIAHNRKSGTHFAYTTQLNLLSGYIREAVKADPARNGSPALSFILDPAFPAYCDEQASRLAVTKNDPDLLGHFSDNEIAFMHTEFSRVLAIPDRNNKCLQAALRWMREIGVDARTISRDQKEAFIGTVTETYYRTVAAAIRKHDPNHLYLGSRLHSSAKDNKHIFRSAVPFIDIVSINYYGYWAPQQHHLAEWAEWSDKPFFITEFYTKAEDSGLPNVTGAGWLVHTQVDRGVHYQNFCLELLRSANCVGWHWFRYQDNDPADPAADPSNNDSNKGIVDKRYETHQGLTGMMKELNERKYRLADRLTKAGKDPR